MAKDKGNRWEIGGRAFELRPPVYGQLDQVGELMEQAVDDLIAVRVMDGDDGGGGLGAALKCVLTGGRMERFVAIVVREEGQALADKDLDELAGHMAEHLGGVQAREVADAFFGLPGVAEEIEAARSARNRLARLVAEDVAQIAKKAKKAAAQQSAESSGKTSSSCAGETGTRRERVLWSMTPEDAEPWLEHCGRDVLYRDAVLAFLGVRDEPEAPASGESARQEIGAACGGRVPGRLFQGVRDRAARGVCGLQHGARAALGAVAVESLLPGTNYEAVCWGDDDFINQFVVVAVGFELSSLMKNVPSIHFITVIADITVSADDFCHRFFCTLKNFGGMRHRGAAKKKCKDQYQVDSHISPSGLGMFNIRNYVLRQVVGFISPQEASHVH